jgi:putative Mn2+ efflux pump MntP
MIANFLLPRYFKLIGIVCSVSGYVMGGVMEPDLSDLTNCIGLLVQVLILVGLLMICGAKEKTEDEFIKYYRLTSLQLAVLLYIFLRLLYKTLAWYTADLAWTPHWQVNSLLLFYLVFFYYQVYIKDFIVNLLKKGEGQ